MKHQALISSKNKSKIIKVSSVAILLGALRVNGELKMEIQKQNHTKIQNQSQTDLMIQEVFDNFGTPL